MPGAVETTQAPAAPAAPPPNAAPATSPALAGDPWELAKTNGRKAAEKSPLSGMEDEIAASLSNEEAAAGTEGEKPGETAEPTNAKEGEQPAADAKKEPERDVTTERVPSKEWARLLGREADLKKKTANRKAALDKRESELNERAAAVDARIKEAEGKVTQTLERAKVVAAIESSDPWESFQAFAAAKGWDETKAREALGVVFRRYANGGAASVDERIAAVERQASTAAETAAERVRKELETKQAEEKKKQDEERAATQEAERVKRAAEVGKADITAKFNAALTAGHLPFLRAFPADRVSEVVWSKMLDHFKQSGGELLEVDKVLSDLNTGVKQEYERLAALDPERSRSSAAQRSETDTGTGDPPRANPVTQRGNGSPPRVPTTVSPRLAAERSEAKPKSSSDREDWELAKTKAKTMPAPRRIVAIEAEPDDE
ncbi:MAG TPA: hypothetical protein VFU97_24505 [Xanthobacteraceae bacterium]|nr:hypothetical protein [Xanthobacteraceae bacterium]